MKKILMTIAGCVPALLFAQQTQFTIDGKIDTDSSLHGYIYIVGKGVKHDSVQLVNNTYHLSGMLKQPGTLIYISWRDRPVEQELKETNSVVETGSSMLFVSPGEHIAVKHQLDFQKITVSGSKIYAQYDALHKAIVADRPHMDSLIAADIWQHPDSWLSYMNLKQEVKKFGAQQSAKLYDHLSQSLKQYDEVQQFGMEISSMQAVMSGKTAPGFTLNNTQGHPISLYSYKGKYVLIDFWASWCAPCRAENPTVKGVYNKYHEKGFDVLGVSLDLTTSKQAWLDAIQKDGLTWTQVSDLKGFDSPVAVQYGVHAIPANFLIDPSGKIIAANLRGYDLEKKMDELFGNK